MSNLSNLTAFLGLVGETSIVILLVVMAQLSQRLGVVTRRAPVFRWFYLSLGLVCFGLSLQLIAILEPSDSILRHPIAIRLPMLAGLSLAVVIAWRYWSWLLNERGNRH